MTPGPIGIAMILICTVQAAHEVNISTSEDPGTTAVVPKYYDKNVSPIHMAWIVPWNTNGVQYIERYRWLY